MDLSLSNPFAALEVRKAKKKKQGDPERKKKGAAKNEQNLRLEQQIFGNRQSNVSDWADDDDDGWGAESGGNVVLAGVTNGAGPHSDVHDSEEEIDLQEHFGVELGPEDDHEEHEEKEKQETKAEPSAEELALLEEHRKKYHIQPQRKVSKKELKKKEMEDLDDLLAGFGIDLNESQKEAESSGKKKKKKNKEKGMAESKEEGAPSADTATPAQQTAADEEEQDESSSLTAEQIKNKLEKARSAKKRTTSKKSVEIAAAEAKARGKGKKGKKDASHYNQVNRK